MVVESVLLLKWRKEYIIVNVINWKESLLQRLYSLYAVSLRIKKKHPLCYWLPLPAGTCSITDCITWVQAFASTTQTHTCTRRKAGSPLWLRLPFAWLGNLLFPSPVQMFELLVDMNPPPISEPRGRKVGMENRRRGDDIEGNFSSHALSLPWDYGWIVAVIWWYDILNRGRTFWPPLVHNGQEKQMFSGCSRMLFNETELSLNEYSYMKITPQTALKHWVLKKHYTKNKNGNQMHTRAGVKSLRRCSATGLLFVCCKAVTPPYITKTYSKLLLSTLHYGALISITSPWSDNWH